MEGILVLGERGIKEGKEVVENNVRVKNQRGRKERGKRGMVLMEVDGW